MKVRNTAIALGISAATAAGLSLLKVDKPHVMGSTAVVLSGGLMIAWRERKVKGRKPYSGNDIYKIED